MHTLLCIFFASYEHSCRNRYHAMIAHLHLYNNILPFKYSGVCVAWRWRVAEQIRNSNKETVIVYKCLPLDTQLQETHHSRWRVVHRVAGLRIDLRTATDMIGSSAGSHQSLQPSPTNNKNSPLLHISW